MIETDSAETNKTSSKGVYNTYVLRMWHEDETDTWRATVKDVRDGKQHNFSALAPLIAFIEKHNRASDAHS